jgi:hypothetical protein
MGGRALPRPPLRSSTHRREWTDPPRMPFIPETTPRRRSRVSPERYQSGTWSMAVSPSSASRWHAPRARLTLLAPGCAPENCSRSRHEGRRRSPWARSKHRFPRRAPANHPNSDGVAHPRFEPPPPKRKVPPAWGETLVARG